MNNVADYCSNIKDEVEVTPYRKIQNGSITGDMVKDRTITRNKLAEGVIPPINNKHNYSTTEQVIGKWIDNKPVYEKTFVVEQDSATQVYSIDVTDLDIDTMLNTVGTCQLGSQADNQWITVPMFESGNFNVFINYLSGDKIVRIQATGWGVTNAYVTIRYTKTTDVPNT